MIKHIVMWKFKDGEEENRDKFLSQLQSLYGVIPELKYCEVAVNVDPKNNYDAVLISEFESLDDLKKYKKDPRHVKVSELCKSIRTERGAVDYEF